MSGRRRISLAFVPLYVDRLDVVMFVGLLTSGAVIGVMGQHGGDEPQPLGCTSHDRETGNISSASPTLGCLPSNPRQF